MLVEAKEVAHQHNQQMYKQTFLIIFALIPAASFASDMAVSVKASTLGIVVDTTRYVSDKVNVRFGFSQSVKAVNGVAEGIYSSPYGPSYGGQKTYSYDYRQQTLGALVDWHPWEGRFRASAGLFLNNNNTHLMADATCSVTGQAVPCTYSVGGNSYSPTQISQPQGKLSYRLLAPYIGYGWGNALAKNKKWTFACDVGMLYQGKPTVTLTATGNVPGLQADLAAEQARLRSESSAWWPVVSFGLGYNW